MCSLSSCTPFRFALGFLPLHNSSRAKGDSKQMTSGDYYVLIHIDYGCLLLNQTKTLRRAFLLLLAPPSSVYSIVANTFSDILFSSTYILRFVRISLHLRHRRNVCAHTRTPYLHIEGQRNSPELLLLKTKNQRALQSMYKGGNPLSTCLACLSKGRNVNTKPSGCSLES